MTNEELKNAENVEEVSGAGIKKLSSTGFLLKQTWQMLKKNFRELIKAIALPAIICVVISVWQENSSVSFFANGAKSPFLSSIAGLILSLCSLWLGLTVIYFFKERNDRSVNAALLGLKKILPALGIWIISGVICFIGYLLFIIPGIIFSIWLCFAIYALVLENKGVIESLSRSKQLVSGHWWSVFWRSIVLGVIVVGFSLVISGISIIFGQSITSLISLFASVIQSLIIMFVCVPFAVFFASNLYQELKTLKE